MWKHGTMLFCILNFQLVFTEVAISVNYYYYCKLSKLVQSTAERLWNVELVFSEHFGTIQHILNWLLSVLPLRQLLSTVQKRHIHSPVLINLLIVLSDMNPRKQLWHTRFYDWENIVSFSSSKVPFHLLFFYSEPKIKGWYSCLLMRLFHLPVFCLKEIRFTEFI